MATLTIPTLPTQWCLDPGCTEVEDVCINAKTYTANYDANKRYLGRDNNLNRLVYTTLEFVFRAKEAQKAFFDWWGEETEHGGKQFYAKIPLYADDSKYYLLVQSTALVQKVDTYKVTGKFMLFRNKVKGDNTKPVVETLDIAVTEGSQNNVTMINVEDADGDIAHELGLIEPVDNDRIKVVGLSIIYTPPSATFTGEESFQYRAFDGVLWSDPKYINVLVVEVSAPVAPKQDLTVAKSNSGTAARYFTLDAYDIEGRELTYTITNTGTTIDVEMAANNVSSETTPWVMITVDDTSETVSFQYKANNGVKDSNIQTVNVEVVTEQPFEQSLQPPTMVSIPTTEASGVDMVIFESIAPSYDAINCAAVQYSFNSSTTFPNSISDVRIINYAGDHPVTALQESTLVVTTSGIHTEASFDFLFNFIGANSSTPGSIRVNMIDTSDNRRSNTISTIYAHLQIPSAEFEAGVTIGLAQMAAFGYPSTTDFPDAIWEEIPIMNVGGQDTYGDIFIEYKNAAISGSNASLTDNGDGTFDLSKTAGGASDYYITWKNKAGNTITVTVMEVV